MALTYYHSCMRFIALFLLPLTAIATESTAKLLNWIPDDQAYCGGYYLEPIQPVAPSKDNAVHIQGNEGVWSLRGTSSLEGNASISQGDQQISAKKIALYRDPQTGELVKASLLDNVRLEEPHTLLYAREGNYEFNTRKKSLLDLLYRTAIHLDRTPVGSHAPFAKLNQESKSSTPPYLTAFGEANTFEESAPHVYTFENATFSTCRPDAPAWHIKANQIRLDKNSGRGEAIHTRLYLGSVPVFYFPYFNFPIDKQRKSGFLWPTFGVNHDSGAYFFAPIYWNIAPNLDMTFTPGAYSKRGTILKNNFRFLYPYHNGSIDFNLLPYDHLFGSFQSDMIKKYSATTDDVVRSELNRLRHDSTTRGTIQLKDDARYDDHLSGHLDINYASDDYFLRDFGNNLNEVTQNQLLQQADLLYQTEHWSLTSRLLAYQTLHPIVENEPTAEEQYRELPDILFRADYPDQRYGLDPFLEGDLTHFEILKTPGKSNALPVGERFHIQPGIGLPLDVAGGYLIPRMQLALTHYALNQTSDTETPQAISRAIPILDLASGITLSRPLQIWGQPYRQTLEPQLYYTYIPYRNQSDIPLFDTSLSTLTYDQLFAYNRFSGVDRIGDTNQVALGLSTRFYDNKTGNEKIRLGLGEIIYFSHRQVTLCNDQTTCFDNPTNPSLKRGLSPISGLANYHINPLWQVTGNAIWDPISRSLDNTTVSLHFEPRPQSIVNLGFSYVKQNNIYTGVPSANDSNNKDALKMTDASLSWPVLDHWSVVGRWSQDWSAGHFQTLLYGLQYDTCCWSMRLVGNQAFTGLSEDSHPNYNNVYYVQFTLKGLGNFGTGNPASALSSISGFNTQFGQTE